MRFSRFGYMFLLAFAALVTGIAATRAALPALGPGVPSFTVRPGFRVTLAASHLSEARFLCFDNHGTLFVSGPGHGQILALRKADAHGKFQSITTFIHGYSHVQCMVYRNNWLWFATSTGVYKVADSDGIKPAGPVQTIIDPSRLPKFGGHWWRSLLVTKHHLYTSVGDLDNITDCRNLGREIIWRYNRDGTGKTLWCSGIRNTERLRMRPGTREIWGCDEGSDNFGHPLGEHFGQQRVTDLNPPEEFNHYIRGGFYGHPYVVGNNIPRYELLHNPKTMHYAEISIPPAWCFHAHWSTISFTFLTSDYFPGMKGDAIVACHGSWDSTKKVGYRLQCVLFDKLTGKPYGSFRIVSTLGPNNSFLARPVDVAEAPDGSIYFSSDSNGCVYHVTWIGKKPDSDTQIP